MTLGHERKHLELAIGELREGALLRFPDQSRDDRRVEHALAVDDALQCIDKHGDVRNALLEEIA